jgi:hypothetical protein
MDEGHAGEAPLFEPWRPFNHPQLGAVEIGGIHNTASSNPVISADEFPSLLRKFHDFTLLAAKMAPRVVCEGVQVDAIAGGSSGGADGAAEVAGEGTICYRVRAKIANRGELPTNLTNRGRSLARRCPPVQATFVPATADGVEVASATAGIEVGALAGVVGRSTLEWFVTAPATTAAGGKAASAALGEIRIEGGTGGDSAVQVVVSAAAGGAP